MRILGIVLYVLWLGFALLLGSTVGWLHKSKIISYIVNPPKTPPQEFGNSEFTVLVLGCDEDLAPGGKVVLRKQARSDMMLVVKFDFPNKKITGISIPRDTLCQVPGYKPMKINAYHSIAKKGEEASLTEDAVETLLPSVHIDRVVTLDFDAFQRLVNMLGGVDVDVKRRMQYTDRAGGLYIDFKPGLQHMNGYQAMCYVRYRHGDSDFVREERQREFALDMKQQIRSRFLDAPAIADQVIHVMGDAFTDEEAGVLARFIFDVGPENIQMGQVPVVDGRGTDLLVDQDKLPAVLAQYGFAESPSDKTSTIR